MILASEEDVIARLALENRTGTTSSANSGLNAASPELENVIGTRFAREDRVDYFGCVSVKGSASDPEYVLNLTNSILDTEETVKVYTTSDGLPITGVTGSTANVTELAAADFEVRHEQGRIHIFPGTTFTFANVRRSIAVRYISGFDVGGDNNLADQEQVPAWLREAAITMCIRTMRASSAPKPKVNALEYRQQLSNIARSLVANYIRTRLVGDYPMGTELK